MLKKFDFTFESLKNSIPEDIAKDFEEAISLSLNFTNNTKHFEINENTFAQLLNKNYDNDFFIPAEANKTSMNLSQRKYPKQIQQLKHSHNPGA